ncbi:glycine cleavage system protein GcvH [Cohaesibacter haloalkalitolerans]|jgi:glycine cleavage system H protein|uniref:glycine cleavage system protein GcvH n=1 Tax=Cohaesibacter haloalkalitolerans TaxID=1162980 RepID=UPI000E657BBF|nr:glycine cleavage system protein GcvH [Cohaesibacter haloalkalitolerans]
MTTYYSEDHEWVEVNGKFATVGITDFAQKQLGDVVFVELPEVGRELEKGEEAAVVESVKAASEVYSPIDGEVTEVNETLEDEPALVNSDAESDAWFFKIKIADKSQLDDLMNEEDYKAFVAEQE